MSLAIASRRALADNVNDGALGDLGLTSAEEAAIVAFPETVSDGYLTP